MTKNRSTMIKPNMVRITSSECLAIRSSLFRQSFCEMKGNTSGTQAEVALCQAGEVKSTTLGRHGSVSLVVFPDASSAICKQIPIRSDFTLRTQHFLEHELTSFSSLSNQFIVNYQNHVIRDNTLCITYEHFPNSTPLDILLSRYGAFPEKVAVLYTSEILQGLRYLHQHGVFHNSLKASNILVGLDGLIKLCDFGICIPFCDLRLENRSRDYYIRSAYWMSPEFIENCNHTSSNDIWSLGNLIIEMLTGKPIFYKHSPTTALYHIVGGTYPDYPVNASQALRNFLDICFEKDPTKRATLSQVLAHEWLIDEVPDALERPKLIRQINLTRKRGFLYKEKSAPSVENINISPAFPREKPGILVSSDRKRRSTSPAQAFYSKPNVPVKDSLQVFTKKSNSKKFRKLPSLTFSHSARAKLRIPEKIHYNTTSFSIIRTPSKRYKNERKKGFHREIALLAEEDLRQVLVLYTNLSKAKNISTWCKKMESFLVQQKRKAKVLLRYVILTCGFSSMIHIITTSIQTPSNTDIYCILVLLNKMFSICEAIELDFASEGGISILMGLWEAHAMNADSLGETPEDGAIGTESFVLQVTPLLQRFVVCQQQQILDILFGCNFLHRVFLLLCDYPTQAVACVGILSDMLYILGDNESFFHRIRGINIVSIICKYLYDDSQGHKEKILLSQILFSYFLWQEPLLYKFEIYGDPLPNQERYSNQLQFSRDFQGISKLVCEIDIEAAIQPNGEQCNCRLALVLRLIGIMRIFSQCPEFRRILCDYGLLHKVLYFLSFSFKHDNLVDSKDGGLLQMLLENWEYFSVSRKLKMLCVALIHYMWKFFNNEGELFFFRRDVLLDPKYSLIALHAITFWFDSDGAGASRVCTKANFRAIVRAVSAVKGTYKEETSMDYLFRISLHLQKYQASIFSQLPPLPTGKSTFCKICCSRISNLAE